jgi:hypothetical protein
MLEQYKKTIAFVLWITIVIAAVGVRLYHFDAPIADWHSWRQVDTAAVARNFEIQGIDLLHPRYDDLSNIQTGKDNPEGYRFVEFPLYQVVGVGLHRVFPTLTIEMSLRILSIAASVGTAIVAAFLVDSLYGIIAGIMTLFFISFLPYSVFYGRTILPDVPSSFFAVLSVYLMHNVPLFGKRRQWVYLFFSAVAASAALLMKPVAGFFLIPAAVILLKRAIRSPILLLHATWYGLIALGPMFAWRAWIAQYPEGVPAWQWLLNKDNIRFKGAWLRWIFGERIAGLILGQWGMIPFGAGLAALRFFSKDVVLWSYVVGTLLYVTIFAGGNVQHDYYQIFLIPTLAMIAGRGSSWLIGPERGVRSWSGILTVVLSTGVAITLSWYTIRTYYWINHPELISAGTAVKRLVPKDAKIIAPYSGDTTFLYQTGHQGWPIGFEIDDKMKMGATTYVSVASQVDDGELVDLSRRYTVLERTKEYIIIDLTKPVLHKE